MKTQRIFLTACVIALCLPAWAEAAIVRIDFMGVFNSTTDGFTRNTQWEGESYSGWFTYDTDGNPLIQQNRPSFVTAVGRSASLLSTVLIEPAHPNLQVFGSGLNGSIELLLHFFPRPLLNCSADLTEYTSGERRCLHQRRRRGRDIP